MSIFSLSVWPHPSKIYSRSVVKTHFWQAQREKTHAERWKFAGKHHHTCTLSLFHCHTHLTHTHTYPEKRRQNVNISPISFPPTFFFSFSYGNQMLHLSHGTLLNLAVCVWKQPLGAAQLLHGAMLHSKKGLNTLWQIYVVALSGYRSLPLKKLWKVVICKRYNWRTSCWVFCVLNVFVLQCFLGVLVKWMW